MEIYIELIVINWEKFPHFDQQKDAILVIWLTLDLIQLKENEINKSLIETPHTLMASDAFKIITAMLSYEICS